MKIFLSAGEVSGDMQGAALARELKRLSPKAEIYGIGGRAMASAGVRILDDITSLSTIGLWETLGFILPILKVYNRIKARLISEPPDAVVMIDNQGFNLILSKMCRDEGITNIYYFPPHVSVWGAWNAEKLKETCDLVVTPFPMDEKVYRKADCPVVYPGHPFADMDLKAPVRTKLNAFPKKRFTVGLMPGSRRQEVAALTGIFLDAAIRLSGMLHGDVRFILPVAHAMYKERIERELRKRARAFADIPIMLLEGDATDDIYPLSDAVILSSGTSSLLASLYGKPMVICYRISPITFAVAKSVVTGGIIGMPNLMLGKKVIPELLQGECNPQAIARYTASYLTDAKAYRSMARMLLSVRKIIGKKGVVRRVAKLVLDAAKEHSPIPRREIRGTPFPLSQRSERGKGEERTQNGNNETHARSL
ncbi:MAG: lipid-A-disaccharide synthase [Spirochaetota bacterium]